MILLLCSALVRTYVNIVSHLGLERHGHSQSESNGGQEGGKGAGPLDVQSETEPTGFVQPDVER